MAEGVTSVKAMRTQMAAQAEDRHGQARTSLVATSPAPASSSKTPVVRPVIDGATLRVDDRLRVAKERREEQEKQQAVREAQVLEREQKSRAQYEQQMEERQRKLEDQRRKEERRRSAVEEKRRQRQEEEKEHYEAVLRRTLERSQRLDQRQKRWSWGGGVNADSSAPDSAVAIVVSPCSPDKPQKKGTPQVDKRLVKQQADPVVSKHVSSSSAALNSPEKTGCPLAALTNGCTLNRLLTPTQASIARSRSAAALSALATSSQVSTCSLPPARRPLRSRSSDRQKPPTTPAALSSTRGPDNTQKGVKEKRFSSPGTKRPVSPSTLSGRRSPSPAPTASSANRRPPSPAPAKPASRSRPPSPTVTKQRPPSPQPSTKPPPIQRPALTPTGPPTFRKRETKPKESSPGQPLIAHTQETAPAGTASSTKTKDDGSTKGVAGSTSAEEAASILSENRRLAREQKEREEQLRVQREEEERLKKEEEKRLAEQQQVQRLEEERRRAEEKKRLEEERLHLAQEERQKLEAEEMARQAEVQRELEHCSQRKEAEARAQEEAEKQRQERERIMQRNQQERMERRKRIEEIMKRTRKTDQSDSKRDEEKGMLDETEEEDSEAKEQRLEEVDHHADEEEQELQQDAERCDHSAEEPLAVQVQPAVNVTGKVEMSTKENNSGEEEVAVSPMPKAQVVDKEPSDALLPGLKCRVGSWNFEELIDQPVHPKAQSIAEAGGRDLINPNTHRERPWVPSEDKVEIIDNAAAPKLAQRGSVWVTAIQRPFIKLLHQD